MGVVAWKDVGQLPLSLFPQIPGSRKIFILSESRIWGWNTPIVCADNLRVRNSANAQSH